MVGMDVTMLRLFSLSLRGMRVGCASFQTQREAGSDGGAPTGKDRREQAAVLSRGGRRLPAARAGQVHRAARLLQPQGAGRPRVAARQSGAREVLAGQGSAALADGEAAGAEICQE